MPDWKAIDAEITDMAQYFQGCLKNAAEGSKAAERYARYIGTLLIISLAVKDKLVEEDDGK